MAKRTFVTADGQPERLKVGGLGVIVFGQNGEHTTENEARADWLEANGYAEKTSKRRKTKPDKS